LPGSTVAAEIAIPGTSVTIDAPAGFTVAGTFSGLENLESGSSITITELPAEAYLEVSQLFADVNTAAQAFAQQGITITEADYYETGDSRIPVLIGSQRFAGGQVGKYLALYSGDVVALITFNVMDPESLTLADFESAAKSVRLSSATSLEERVKQLPFTFETIPPFRINNTILGATVLLATFDGTDTTGLMPVVVIGRAFEAVSDQSDLEGLAIRVLRGTRGFESAQVSVSNPMDFVGARGHYVEATAADRTVVQLVAIPADGMYMRLISYGESEQFERVLPQVLEIARSITVP
jgi:hypothetical protein